MKTVGVREFRDHATRYLGGNEPVTIERRGERIGVYLPFREVKREQLAQALDKLGRTVTELSAKMGLTEDEFADLFDPSKPFPLDDPDHPITKKLEARATRG